MSADAQATRGEGDASAREVVGQLLSLAGIRRVICVDDWYAAAIEVEPVLGALASGVMPVSELTKASPELGSLLDAIVDIDTIMDIVRDAWDGLDPDVAQRIFAVAELASPPTDQSGEPQDAPALEELRGVIPVEFLTMRLHDWRRQAGEFLADGIPTLLLLDRNFDRESLGADAGEQELVRLHSIAPEQWRFCLLTHTVGSADEEGDLWRVLRERYGKDAGRFIVIAKSRLTGHPSEFPGVLRLALLNTTLKRLMVHIREAVTSTWEDALSRLDELDPYALQQAIAGNRYNEGSWGPETLLRLAIAFCQDRVRMSLHGDDKVHSDGSFLTQLSQLEMPIEADFGPLTAELLRIQRLEYLDDKSLVEYPTLPLESGDIFEVLPLGQDDQREAFNSFSSYIVIGQPCDLMIRQDGRRGSDRLVAMAPIEYKGLSKKAPRSNQVGQGDEHSFTIPYVNGDASTIGHVLLNRAFQVPLHVLDFCVLSGNGESTWIRGQICPPKTVPSWQSRWNHLNSWAEATLTEHRETFSDQATQESVRNAMKALMGVSHLGFLEAVVDFEVSSIRFGLKRVARLRDPYRGALVLKAAQREMRQAFESWLLDKK